MVDPQKIETVKNWVQHISMTEAWGWLATIIALSVEGKDFIIYCDTSHSNLGIVLMHDKNVIAYASQQLKVHERYYPKHDLELAAVAFALKIWRHYPYRVKCEVFIDHRNQQHVFTQRDLNLRHRRWMELLKDYDVTIQYHSGKANVVGDALRLKQLGISEKGGVLARIGVRLTFIEEINAKQFEDKDLKELRKKTLSGKAQNKTLDASGPVAYRLALLPCLSGVHLVFHVSMWKNYHRSGDYIIKWDSMLLLKDLRYEREPIIIVDRDVRKLRTNEIKSVKFQWKHLPMEEFTWVTEKDIRDKYPSWSTIQMARTRATVVSGRGEQHTPFIHDLVGKLPVDTMVGNDLAPVVGGQGAPLVVLTENEHRRYQKF
ncbi:hypothetical protein MTR67_048223 [Solanum verrucosum]|uniref:Reverse transcriptase RNase H-like domain-containing protein n=1 Tax=Solanum verrucosum TaxID=315347 RepID=A0AAF0V122_SOLVR|nr:hypothetical protein MTR67_048223 [Solanum verrucosum]